MTIVKRNFAANLAGAASSALVSVAMVPIYIRLVGIEAFGLIGFQATLHSILVLFDLGLSTTVNRELARLSAGTAPERDAGAIVRTAETLYWTITLIIGGVLFAAAPIIVTRWLDSGHYDVATLTTVLRLAVVTVVLQIPYNFYAAGLLGVQRHVVLNAILASGTVVRAGGAVLVLMTISRDIRMLFGWFAIAAGLQTLAAAIALHAQHTGSTRRFDLRSLAHAWKFAAGVAGAGVIAAVALQIDKLAASKLLPLDAFGVYSLAGAVAGMLSMLVTPVQSTVFPRLSQLVAADDQVEIALIYHRACQTLSTILLPLTTTLVFFSAELVLLWTRDPAIARSARWPIALLVSGAALNALSHISHALQLAHGWTAPSVVANVVQLIVMIPLTVGAIREYGVTGAAGAWLLLQFSFLVISVTVTHRRTLRNDFRIWLLRDVAAPLTAAIVVAASIKFLVRSDSYVILALALASSALLGVAAAGLSTPVVRGWLVEQWRRREIGIS